MVRNLSPPSLSLPSFLTSIHTDVAVFPDNSGHYVVNTSETEELIWIEIFKADRVADISLTQWLALTPTALVAQMLNVSEHVVKRLKTEKQVIIA